MGALTAGPSYLRLASLACGRVDFLGEGAHRLAQGVYLLREVGIPLEQIGLGLGELISVLRGGFLIRLVGPRLGLLGDDHEAARVESPGREQWSWLDGW